MNKYVILTDSACDIYPELLREWGVDFTQLNFTFDGDDHVYLNNDMAAPVFYDRMRRGEVARTSAVNLDTFHSFFEGYLRQGLDICYLGFSSGLSSTCDTAAIAAKELMEAYPQRTVRVVDTLCASAGFGLLLYHTVEKMRAGATLEEAAAFAEENKLHLCHWFTVDNLTYLKRGGRVSPTAAAVGQFLQIKPVLHVDDAGHLIPVSKVRGRRASLAAMAEQYGKTVLDKSAPIFISHGDCREDAEALATMLCEDHGARSQARIFDVGPVIGGHSGPGTLALFFLGDHR